MSIKIEFWGDYACFTRPEMKVERVSYDVPTPSAARGMVESIYFHPEIQWLIKRIYVCNPILLVETPSGWRCLRHGNAVSLNADGKTQETFASIGFCSCLS